MGWKMKELNISSLDYSKDNKAPAAFRNVRWKFADDKKAEEAIKKADPDEGEKKPELPAGFVGDEKDTVVKVTEVDPSTGAPTPESHTQESLEAKTVEALGDIASSLGADSKVLKSRKSKIIEYILANQ